MPNFSLRHTFDADAVADLSKAYEGALQALGLPVSASKDDPNSPHTQVARRIFLAAQKGERRPEVLRRAGTLHAW